MLRSCMRQSTRASFVRGGSGVRRVYERRTVTARDVNRTRDGRDDSGGGRPPYSGLRIRIVTPEAVGTPRILAAM